MEYDIITQEERRDFMTGEQELLLALLRGELTGTAAELDEKTLREADWDVY